MILLSCALKHTLQDQLSNLKFSKLYLLVLSRPDLLLIGRDVDLGLLSPFLRMVQHQTKKGVIMNWDHSFHPDRWHTDVDQDDSLHSVCHENGVYLVGTRLVVV